MKRPFNEIDDHLETFYGIKENLKSAHKRQRLFIHPSTKSKLIRQYQYQFIESHNAGIDTQIGDEINKLVCILKDVIIGNDISKLQELVSHGILDEINKNSSCNNNDNHNKNDMNDIKNVVTEIIGCILQYNREECLLVISPFIECKYFDFNKFDKPILEDPYKIVLFLHSNSFIDLTASHCKLLHKCVEYGYIKTVQYCIQSGVPIDSRQHKAIRDAARYGHLDIVKLLHSKGADIHHYKEEALRKAAKYGHLDILKYLIKHGADIHAKNSDALTQSVRFGESQCAEYLIKTGDLSKNENMFITQEAIKNKRYHCLSLLVRYGYVLFDRELQTMALSAIYGEIENNDNSNSNNKNENIQNGLNIDKPDGIPFEIESSASPPMSPTVSPMYSPILSPTSPHYLSSASSTTSSVSPIYGGGFDDFIVEDEVDTKQRFLDAILEGITLRETMILSILSKHVIDEIGCIICSFEKLSVTEEDEIKLRAVNRPKPRCYKARNFSI